MATGWSSASRRTCSSDHPPGSTMTDVVGVFTCRKLVPKRTFPFASRLASASAAGWSSMYWGIEKSMVPAEYARTSKLPTDLDEIIVAIYYNDMVRRPDISMTPSEIRELLASQWTGVLASNGRDGFPHQVAMGYLPEPDRLLMWTYRKAQKTVGFREVPHGDLVRKAVPTIA